MAYLQLRDLASGEEQDFTLPLLRIGRDPELEIVPVGPVAEVVSAHHVRLQFENGQWWIEDMGSSNGTFLNGERLSPGEKHPLVRGAEVRLGRGGPHFSVLETQARRVSPTLIEEVLEPPAPTAPISALPDLGTSQPGPVIQPALTLRDVRSNSLYECQGEQARIGRARDCDVQILSDEETSVSRVHAEIQLANQRVTLRDLGSRNGTYLNGERIQEDRELFLRDKIQLGPGGPELIVEAVSLSGYRAIPRPEMPPDPRPSTASEEVEDSPAALGSDWAKRRSHDGKSRKPRDDRAREADGADKDEEAAGFARDRGNDGDDVAARERNEPQHTRRLVMATAVVLALSAGGFYWYSRTGGAEGDRPVQPPTSVRQVGPFATTSAGQTMDEITRLESALADARASTAEVAVIDSLTEELEAVRARQLAFDQALGAVQSATTTRLASIDSIREELEREVNELRAELTGETSADTSREEQDSLRAAVSAAQERIRELEGRARAIEAVDLARVARENHATVGVVHAYMRDRVVSGSGFIIAPSGYFVTDRSVIMSSTRRADSVFVRMVNQRDRVPAQVVAAPGGDEMHLAVLMIPYRGESVARVDWTTQGVVGEEPATTIGFATGEIEAGGAAGYPMLSVGMLREGTLDRLEFDGFTMVPSAGSPVFNTTGNVIAVLHAASPDVVGSSFAVPVTLVERLLPAEIRQELGLVR